MRPEPVATAAFETPARTERLQLLAYLLRNAAQPVYLRGPPGSGKTSAAALVAQAMDDVAGVIWLNAEQAGDLRSVFAGELARAGLPSEPWPQVLDDGAESRDWLVVIDDVDRLDPMAARELARLPLSRVRLLLLGEGGPDGAIPGPVQFLDLPPFNREQAARFLRGQAGAQAARVTDDLVAGLYRATDGQPGALLAALDEVLRHETPLINGRPPGRLGRHLAWGGGAVLALTLATVLLFQDQINHWLQGEPAAAPPRVAAPEAPVETRREGGAAAPPASLAQPSQPAPSTAGADTGPDRAGFPQPQPVIATGHAEVDPLDAVLRDALAALEATPRRQPPAASATVPPPTPAAPPVVQPQPPADAQSAAGAADGAGTAAQDGQARPTVAPEPYRPPPAQTPQPTSSEVTRSVSPAQAQEAAGDAPAPARPPARESAKSGPDPGAQQGAEVVDRSRPVAAGPPSRDALPAPGKAPAVVEAGSHPPAGSWLDTRKPERYTLQLVGARDRDAVERFVARHGIEAPYAIFERRLDGRPWYALVAGDYPDRAAALLAREALPAGVRAADVWPRTFASIREMQRAP